MQKIFFKKPATDVFNFNLVPVFYRCIFCFILKSIIDPLVLGNFLLLQISANKQLRSKLFKIKFILI